MEREKRLEEERGKFLEKAKQIIIDPDAGGLCRTLFPPIIRVQW
ncbi:unnamed protein product [Dibothriocephalus latus]|uniref:Uncharacterized protein n=1 Tax=Dibothriocephalus latus TaxID=60516 RepID=A0A3P7Q1I5_DIBLA|nr:unnamed protein product [Dibothriocephalus latus]